MEFSKRIFKSMLETDYWLIENMLTLPSDPSPIIRDSDNSIHIRLFDTYSMKDQQQAVREYRRRILPAVFIIAQKIYAEIFRLVLANNGYKADSKQVCVQNLVKLKLNNLDTLDPFKNVNELNGWWKETYNFNQLRLARNYIVHNMYQFDGKLLKVSKNSGEILLYWDNDQILEFIEKVREKANFIIE